MQRAQLLEGGRVEGSVGGTEETRAGPAEQFDPSDLFEELFVLIVCGEGGHHRVCLRVVADDVAGLQLEEGSGGEVALLLADREEGRLHAVVVEDSHELLGVGAGPSSKVRATSWPE